MFLPLVCAAVLMVKRPHDALAPWASLAMLLSVLGNPLAAEAFTNLFSDPLLAGQIFNSVADAFALVVLTVFPTGRFEPRWSLLVASGCVLQEALVPWLEGDVANFLFVAAQGCAVATVAARYRSMPPGIGRQQIRWALLGFAFATVAILLWVLLRFMAGYVNTVGGYVWLSSLLANTFSALSGGLVVGGMTISLLRYRLYDADATISRSVVYGALTLGILAVFAGSEKIVEIIGEQYLGERLGVLAGGLGAAVAAISIGPLHHRVTKWAERRFRGGLVNLRDGLPPVLADLRETDDPAMLADIMLERVENGLRSTHGAVLVDGALLDTRDIDPSIAHTWIANNELSAQGSKALRCDRTDPVFPVQLPLRSDGLGLVGWLLLGPRPDGSFYGREEQDALRDIASPVARALSIALKRQRRRALRQSHDEDVQMQIDALRRLVAGFVGSDVASAMDR